MFRAKLKEEDIKVINEVTKQESTISLKAYGIGPLQLSTDKKARMFSLLESYGAEVIPDKNIPSIFESPEFQEFQQINILPLIYDEAKKKCNVLVFNFECAKKQTHSIEKISEGHGRKHPVYIFLAKDRDYICEVRYGDAAANALQRGLWTHTQKAEKVF